MKKKKSATDLIASKDVPIEEEYPSIAEQLKGKSIWKMLGEARPGGEVARLKWAYGKGKRRRTWDVVLTKSEHPVPMEEIAKKFAEIIRPYFYDYLEKHRTDEKDELQDTTKNRRRKKTGERNKDPRKSDETSNPDPGYWEI